MEVIHKLVTVVGNHIREFEVGSVVNDREVIEIKNVSSEFEDSIHSEFHVLDENGDLIFVAENTPVHLDFVTIAVHDGEVKMIG